MLYQEMLSYTLQDVSVFLQGHIFPFQHAPSSREDDYITWALLQHDPTNKHWIWNIYCILGLCLLSKNSPIYKGDILVIYYH